MQIIKRTIKKINFILLKNGINTFPKYFNKIEDEIPDQLPWVGYLDDAVVVRWVLEDLLADYGKYCDT